MGLVKSTSGSLIDGRRVGAGGSPLPLLSGGGGELRSGLLGGEPSDLRLVDGGGTEDGVVMLLDEEVTLGGGTGCGGVETSTSHKGKGGNSGKPRTGGTRLLRRG